MIAPYTQAREAPVTLHPAYFQHVQVCGGAGSAKRQGSTEWLWARGPRGTRRQRSALRQDQVVSPAHLAEAAFLGKTVLPRPCSQQENAQPKGKGCGEEGSLRDAYRKPAGGRTRSRQNRCSNSTKASWGPHHGEVGGGEIQSPVSLAPGALARPPPPPHPVREFRNLRSKASVDVAMGRCQSSRSQQEACSWPLEPQEGDQAPGEGGSKGVDEFL